MNHVDIVGRLVRNPELRYTQSGTAVANFRLARNERSGETERPLFVDVTVWGKLAETVVAHKKQGDQVAVEGRLDFSEYTDRQGAKRSKLSIIAHSVEFLARKHSEDEAPVETAAVAAPVSAVSTSEMVLEEIPF